MDRKLVFSFAVLVLLPLCEISVGQPVHQPTVLKGIVLDSAGAVIVNASIVLEDNRSRAIAQATSDQTGQYAFSVPASGVYRTRISASGFKTAVFEDLQLSGGVVILRDAVLQVGRATEIIYVNETLAVAKGQVATEGYVGIFGEQSDQDTPFNVRSYTRTLLQNQLALTLPDALVIDAAVTSPFVSKASPSASPFLIRGFPVYQNTSLAINGLFGLYGDISNMYFVERVDVFNGPSAFVMGAPGSVGGVVNLAPKRAGNRPFLLIAPEYLGSSVYGASIDASDRFGSHGQWGARVNGNYRAGDGEIRDSRLMNAGAAVALDYRSKIVSLSLDSQYIRNYEKPFQYVVVLGPEFTGLPLAMPSNLSTQPVWMSSSTDQKIILGRADIAFSSKWTLTTGSGYSHAFRGYPAYCPIFVLDYSGSVLCEQIDQATKADNYSNDFGVHGKFKTGAVSHTIVGGWSRVQQTTDFGYFHDFGPSQPYNLYLPFRPTSPNFVVPELSTDFVIDDESTKGWYVGDSLAILQDRVLLTGGLRRVTQGIKDSVRDNSIPPDSYHANALTPSILGLFKVTPNLMIYGNFIQALEPGWIAPIGTKNAGQALPPFFSNQIEVGGKVHFDSWIGSLSLYRISQANGVEDVSTNPPTFTQHGRQVNKGVELNFAGDLTHGLHALLSASFIHPRQHSTQDPSTEGKSPSSIPGASERVNLSWDVPHLRRLVLSCNLMQNGSAAFDAANRFRVPSWTRLDVGARYSVGEKRPLIIRVTVENLGDKRYWASAFSGGLTPSGPQIVNISISKVY
jgi:iron complex outermembrane recepter protein